MPVSSSKEKRMQTALDDAQAAFWASIVSSYPEVKGGDFDPESTDKFDSACREALSMWLEWNEQNDQ
jgi:hypothetical protein